LHIKDLKRLKTNTDVVPERLVAQATNEWGMAPWITFDGII